MVGMVDMHCHILPGVDDGPEERGEALEMLRMEYQQGVRRIICTPHLRKGMFGAPVKERQKSLELLQEKLRGMGILMELYLGCEFHIENEMWQKLEAEPGYTMAGSRYVLVEFPGYIAEPDAVRYLRDLVTHGFRPIIAHVERCKQIRTPALVHQMARMGVYIQVNAGSLLGSEGWGMRAAARRLLEEDCVHFVGSDAHSTGRRSPCLGDCAEYMTKKIGGSRTVRILIENPAKIIKNEYI